MEQKFKVWDIKAKAFLQAPISFGLDDGICSVTAISSLGDEMTLRQGEFEVINYTGFKNVENKVVYDGDILQTAERMWLISFGTPSTDTYGTGWIAISINTGKSYWLDKSILEGNLIGNKFQNPELLEGVK